MAPSLTIVVTCADRKSLPVTPGLRFRDVPPGTPSERARDWSGRLRIAHNQRPLSALYQGEQWKESLRLAAVAKQAGFSPTLVVASAGLGLQPLDALSPAYAATFAMGSADSVGRTVEEAAAWWSEIDRFWSPLNLATFKDRVLLVLSRSYALPLTDDLKTLGTTNSDCVLMGGAHEVAGLFRLPADATLRRTLGGTLSSLNQRTAIRFLELSGGPSDWLSEAHLQRWDSWRRNSRHRESFDRRRGDDDMVKAWIKAAVCSPAASATRALREYRRQGNACEQGRFGRLYREVVMEK